MSSPTLSIGVITHNRRAYLEDSLQSAFSQEIDGEFEVLVIDNASKDDTKKFLSSIKDTRLRVVRAKKNLGEAGGRNLAIENMNSELMLWLDDDDWLLEGAAAGHLRCLKESPEADIVYGNLRAQNDEGETLEDWAYQQVPAELVLHAMLFYSPFPNGGSLIRKSVFEKAGGYDTSFSRGTDYNFWVHAALAGCRFVHNNSYVYTYRSHSGNFLRGEESPEFNDCNSRVLENLLANASLPQLFPMLDWAGKKAASEAQASARLAMIFAKYECWDRALALLESCEAAGPSPDVKALRAALFMKTNRAEDAANELFTAYVKRNKGLRQLLALGNLLPK